MHKRTDLIAWCALVVVYIAWGATYVAIRQADRDIPPALLAGIRFVLAGALMWPLLNRVGAGPFRGERMGWRQWAACAVVGALLLTLGNGGVTVAERVVPAGTAALLVATVPLWMALFGRLLYGARIGTWGVAGLLVGTVGVAVIVRPGSGGRLGGMLITLGAAAAWGLGSMLAGRLPLPRRPLASPAAQMLVGGALLLVLAAASGQRQVHAWSAGTTWSMVFLVLGGSMLGYTCYAYALAHLPGSIVATYAYVNPVVAVALGWLLLGETMDWWTGLGAVLVVASVAVTVLGRARQSRQPQPERVEAPAA